MSNKIGKQRKINEDLSFIAYICDDIDNLSCMNPIKEAGEMIGCPTDAVKKVKEIADFIPPYNGGNGAVRDFIK